MQRCAAARKPVDPGEKEFMSDNTDTTTDALREKNYTLTPTTGRKVKFSGICLATAGGRWQSGREQTRWTELSLYRTKGGKYVLMRDWNTLWQGESCDTTVIICNSPAEVVSALEDNEGELGRLDTELLRDAAAEDPAFDKFTVTSVE